jgi:hypothetical protein
VVPLQGSGRMPPPPPANPTAQFTLRHSGKMPQRCNIHVFYGDIRCGSVAVSLSGRPRSCSASRSPVTTCGFTTVSLLVLRIPCT